MEYRGACEERGSRTKGLEEAGKSQTRRWERGPRAQEPRNRPGRSPYLLHWKPLEPTRSRVSMYPSGPEPGKSIKART